MLVDSHCHLDWFNNIAQVLAQAKKEGVKYFIIPSTDINSALECLKINEQFPQVKVAIGIFPHGAKKINISLKKQLEVLEAMIKKYREKIVAIGECGLDFGNPASFEKARPKATQINLFINQVNLARKYQLPLIIHNRKAHKDLLNILNKYISNSNITGVFHCFTGSKKFLTSVLNLGFYIGINGLITYDQGLQEVIKEAPIKKILLETDAPFLMPEPIRKNLKWPNEPKNVRIVAEKLSQLKNTPIATVAKQTTQNALQLFKL